MAWGVYTEEHHRSNERLLSLGVEILANHAVQAFDGEEAEARCLFSGRSRSLRARSLVSVTAREQRDSLYGELLVGGNGDFEQLARIGDCLQPALIAHAVYAGHRFARELDASQEDLRPRRETVEV